MLKVTPLISHSSISALMDLKKITIPPLDSAPARNSSIISIIQTDPAI